MKKVYLLLVPNLPCPNVKGGAIETLLTNIARENENNLGKIDLHIISKYDKEAILESKKYPHTDFIFIKYSFIEKIIFNLYKLMKRIKKENFNLTYYYYKALKLIPNEADFIIAEGGNNEMFIPFSQKFGKKKLALHLHYELKSNKILNETYGNLISVSNFIEKSYNADSDIRQEVLKNGIDINRFGQSISEDEKEHLRKKYGFSNNDFIVVFCGRIIKEKGIDRLINVIKKINNEKIKLLIVGSENFGAESESEFEKNVKKSIENYEGKIKFTGYVPNENLYKIHQISDVLCIPSVWDDPAPLVAIEGMASGIPIIATKSGGMIEYINAECAEIIEKDEKIEHNLENAIVNLFNDQKRRNEMSKAGKEIVKEFTVQKYYDDFVKIINKWE